jgi:hypothetical protein
VDRAVRAGKAGFGSGRSKVDVCGGQGAIRGPMAAQPLARTLPWWNGAFP